MLMTSGMLLMLGAFSINTESAHTIFGIAPDWFKGLVMGMSIGANILATIGFVKAKKATVNSNEGC
jgi:hypothetical protein